MKERKWTPGPWRINFDNQVCVQVDGEYHAVCTDQFCYAPQSEQNANARLIAAAPDLYEALEQALDDMQMNGLDIADYLPALAKARGEA